MGTSKKLFYKFIFIILQIVKINIFIIYVKIFSKNNINLLEKLFKKNDCIKTKNLTIFFTKDFDITNGPADT